MTTGVPDARSCSTRQGATEQAVRAAAFAGELLPEPILNVRLVVLERGHGWTERARVWIGRLLGRPEPNPVTKTVSYGPELFRAAWLRLARPVMQGPSDWSTGERELLGAFASRLNCPLCAGFHETAAVKLLGSTVTAQSIGYGPEAGLNPRLATAMKLFEKTTLTPDDVAVVGHRCLI